MINEREWRENGEREIGSSSFNMKIHGLDTVKLCIGKGWCLYDRSTTNMIGGGERVSIIEIHIEIS